MSPKKQSPTHNDDSTELLRNRKIFDLQAIDKTDIKNDSPVSKIRTLTD